MSALSDLQKKLEQEAQGIMFPFSAKAPTVNTTQQVYDSATDGIMNMQGKKYVGPDSVIQYTPEGQRQLKEIEKGMLPQFDQEQFPDVGQGKVEDRGGTPPFDPTTSYTPSTFQTQTPAFDPCPAGFKFDPQLQRCVPVQKQKSDRQTGPSNPPRNIGPAANAVSTVADAIKKLSEKGGVFGNLVDDKITLEIDNSSILSNFGFLGKFIDEVFIKNPADKKFIETFGGGKDSPYSTEELKGIAVIKEKDGKLKATFDKKGRQNFDNIATGESLKGNLASTQKKDDKGNIIIAPNGKPMIVGPIRVTPFGTTDSSAGFKSSPSYKIKEGKVVYDEPQKKKTFTYKAPKKGTGSSGPPGSTPKSNKITRAKNLTNRAAPRKVNIKSEKFSGKGFTRGR